MDELVSLESRTGGLLPDIELFLIMTNGRPQ